MVVLISGVVIREPIATGTFISRYVTLFFNHLGRVHRAKEEGKKKKKKKKRTTIHAPFRILLRILFFKRTLLIRVLKNFINQKERIK